MNLSSFLDGVFSFFSDMYNFTNSVSPFTDYPDLSLFWLFESLVLTSIAWQLFPDEFSSNFNENDIND